MKRMILGFLLFCVIGINLYCVIPASLESSQSFYSTSRPYTRWWWFAGMIKKADIRCQLDWLKKTGFGGVEIAFIYPVNRDPRAKRFKWLGPEWQEAVVYAKQYAEGIGLGCDFTFGTLWPFGGTFVSDNHRTRVQHPPCFVIPGKWKHEKSGLKALRPNSLNNSGMISNLIWRIFTLLKTATLVTTT